jgi:hypothetical protein
VPEGLRFSAKNPLFRGKVITESSDFHNTNDNSLGVVRRAIRSQGDSFAGRFVARSFEEAIIFWNIVRRGDHFFGEHRSQRRSFILSTVSPRSHRKSKGRYSRRQQTRHKAKSPYFFYRGIAKFRNASNFSLLAFIIFVCSQIFLKLCKCLEFFCKNLFIQSPVAT